VVALPVPFSPTALNLSPDDDIVVQQTISNYGDQPIDYTAFAIVPGHAREADDDVAATVDEVVDRVGSVPRQRLVRCELAGRSGGPGGGRLR
jgi:hypothetical protein